MQSEEYIRMQEIQDVFHGRTKGKLSWDSLYLLLGAEREGRVSVIKIINAS